MKAWWGVLALVAVMTGGLRPAAAEPQGFSFLIQTQMQRGQPPERLQREQRDLRRDYRAEPGRDERRRDRLTEQERRDLRRDIDQANRDIYRRHRNR